MFKTIKRDLIIILWTLVFLFGSMIPLGVGLSMYKDKNPGFDDAHFIHLFANFDLFIIAPIGLILGIFGLLPGTKKK